MYVDSGEPLVADIGGSFSGLDTEGQYYLGMFIVIRNLEYTFTLCALCIMHERYIDEVMVT